MHLESRTTGDCVAHYYRIQKLDEFAAVRRKQQLKKRRQQSEVNRSITYLGIASVTGVKRGDHPLAQPGGAFSTHGSLRLWTGKGLSGMNFLVCLQIQDHHRKLVRDGI